MASPSLALFVTGIALHAASLAFTAPDGWKTVTTTSSMRLAQFSLPRADGDAEDGELVVYFFGGSGGSVDANIQRWIGQIQQPDGKPSGAVAKKESRKVNGLALTLVDVSGTYNPSRISSGATAAPDP